MRPLDFTASKARRRARGAGPTGRATLLQNFQQFGKQRSTTPQSQELTTNGIRIWLVTTPLGCTDPTTGAAAAAAAKPVAPRFSKTFNNSANSH